MNNTGDNALEVAASVLLRCKESKMDFVNDVLDLISDVDRGVRVYWNSFDDDRNVRKALRAFLTALKLKQVEKKSIKNSGLSIHMAFVKAPYDDRPRVLEIAQRALELALRTMISDQVARFEHLLTEKIPEEEPVILRDDTVNFDDSMGDIDTELSNKPTASGLLSLESYKALHETGALGDPALSRSILKEDTEVPDIFAKSNRDHAAIAKFNKTQRLQNELWGLSASRQSKLRRHLDTQ